MLLPAEVRPFLSHEDGFVRALALAYLAGAHDIGPTTQEDLWATLDRYGKAPKDPKEERRTFARELASFPPTERSTERLLEGLRIEVDDDVLRCLVRAAGELPPGAVRRLLDDPRIVGRLSPEEVEALRYDLDLAGKSADALARELCDHAARLDTATGRPVGGLYTKDDPLVQRADHLVRALARHPEQAAAHALDVLRGRRGGAGPWEETLALMIFGRVRLPSLEARVLELVDDQEHLLTSVSAVHALVRLGTPEVIRAVDERYAGRTDQLCDGTLAVVHRIKRPESEALLLRLFMAAQGRIDRTELARSLCELCTTSPVAIVAIGELVRTRAYDELYAVLDESWSALLTMVGMGRPVGKG